MNRLAHRLARVALVSLIALGVSGCVGPPMSGVPSASTPPDSQEPAASETDAPAEPTGPAGPVEQAASCEWDIPAITAAAAAPTGQDGELATVLIGSWQHTHIDSGDGWETLDKDIRYVFPAPGQLIYCQHVPGITDHAENSTTHTLEGTLIAPPSHKGFDATAWSADRMVWTNNYDGSRYLLARR